MRWKRFKCWLLGHHHFHLAKATMLRYGDWLLAYRCEHCGASRTEAVDDLIMSLSAKLGIREKDL